MRSLYCIRYTVCVGSIYFASRAEAGYRLALELMQYRYENCAVVALSDGGVQVGYQIAASLHCTLNMLLMEHISIPGENVLFGTLNQSGRFTYNGMFSPGQVEEYYAEFHGYLEDQKRIGMQRINRLLGMNGIVDAHRLNGQAVILVSDGFPNGYSLDAAADFLRPLSLQKIIVAVPIASVEAVDRMHIVADELHVLGVTDNYLETSHYYEQQDILSHEDTIKALDQIILSWR